MSHARILAIDYGAKRIGLAATDPLGITVQPLAHLTNKSWNQVFQDLGKILQEKSIAHVIVGLPKSPDGGEGAQAKTCREFADKLAKEYSIPIELVDETMTSREAHEILIEKFDLSREKRKGAVDSLSACLMLETYLGKKK